MIEVKDLALGKYQFVEKAAPADPTSPSNSSSGGNGSNEKDGNENQSPSKTNSSNQTTGENAAVNSALPATGEQVFQWTMLGLLLVGASIYLLRRKKARL